MTGVGEQGERPGHQTDGDLGDQEHGEHGERQAEPAGVPAPSVVPVSGPHAAQTYSQPCICAKAAQTPGPSHTCCDICAGNRRYVPRRTACDQWRKTTVRSIKKLIVVAVPCAITQASVIRHGASGNTASASAFIPTLTRKVQP